jgi:hypothetical protein
MKYLPAVARADYAGEFRLHVTFSDGSENTIDFRDWLDGPMFEPLRQLDYFQRFFIDGGTVVWPNGADIAPEALYEVAGRKGLPHRRVTPTTVRQTRATKRSTRKNLRG